MSIDKKVFGLSDSLVETVKEALKGGQKKIDVAPPFGKLTGADFKKLRNEGPEEKDATNPKQGSSVDPKQRSIGEAIATAKMQMQDKIAQKQQNTLQAKSNKRLTTINAGACKCEGACKCDDKDDTKKGGKEPIEVNPTMKEATDLPKKVVTKGHEIAKSLIKHRASVKSPYAVGMATAKKSAGIKEAYDDNSNKPSDWSDKKLKWHASDDRKHSSSHVPAWSELKRRAKTSAPKTQKEEVQVDERNMENKAKKDAAVQKIGSKNKDDQHLSSRGMRTDVADKIRGREVTQGKDRKQYREEVEQIDELSRGTMNSYVRKSHNQTLGVDAVGMGTKKSGIPGYYTGKNKDLGKDPAHKVRMRKAGQALAIKKLNKEEVTQVDEISAMKAIRTAVKRQSAAHGAAIERGDEPNSKEQHKINRSQALIKKKYGEKGDKIVHKAVGKRIGYED